MEESRTSSALRNSLYGFANKIICILVPFLTRTIIIKYLGMEYAGLNNLFSSVLQVLNLAELGISSAVVYCMYKPMANNDNSLLCAILSYMRKLYYIIGCIVIIVGVILIPLLPKLIKGNVPDNLNVYILYIFYLVNTGIGYFFFAYKSTLLNAGQRVGIISNINSAIIIIQGIIQIVILVYLKNYYYFLAIMPIFTLINNIWVSFAVKKYYPDIKCVGLIPASIKRDISIKVKGLFVTKLCTTTRNALDSVFISSFVGLTTVAIYGNYYYIMSAVISVLNVITSAMTAGVGNSLVTESIKKNYDDMRKFNFIFNWIVGFCTACLLVIYQPFMKVWMGKEALFSYRIVILMCIYFYFLNIGSIRAVYHDAAGLWWEARYRAIIEAVLNIVLNLMLTARLGVFGTILGTLISLIVVNYFYGTQIVFKYYFKDISVKQYYIDNLRYMFVTFFACLIVYYIMSCVNTSAIKTMIIAAFVCIIVYNLVYWLCFFNTQIYKDSILKLNGIYQKIIMKIK